MDVGRRKRFEERHHRLYTLGHRSQSLSLANFRPLPPGALAGHVLVVSSTSFLRPFFFSV